MDYTVVPMDDFNVSLRLDFMMANQVVPVPTASCVLFQGDRPEVLATMVTSELPSVRGVGADAVDEDVDKGGQSADGWAGPHATGMCFKHTIEAAPTARVDGVRKGGRLWASGMSYGLGFWLDGRDDGLRLTDCFLDCGQICSRTRLTWSGRGFAGCRSAS
ncbi:hypothetical protein GQ457_01G015640 [Hibiscus cannabinus]